MIKRRRKRVTLGDVAAKAGVSIATASVAITGRPSGNCRVSEAVAKKIRRAARALNYRPNLQARNLSTQRTQTIAMLVKRSNWHNAMWILAAAQRVLRQAGFTEIFLMNQDDEIEIERGHLEMCLEQRVEGILIMPLIDLAGRTNLRLLNQIQKEEGVPIVQLAIALPGSSAPAVESDEVEGFRQAVLHLHSLGHPRIAHVTLKGYADPDPLNPYRHAHLRYAGYRQAMKQLGLPEQVFASPQRETTVGMEFEHAIAIARQIAALPALPSAILVYSDYEAAGLLNGLIDAGITVPQQVSLLSHGDQQFARMTRPPLATLAPAYEEMGRKATEILLQMIDGQKGESVKIPPTLIARESLQPAAA